MNSRVLIVGLVAVIVFGVFLFKGAKDNESSVQGVETQASVVDERTTDTLGSQTKSMGAVEVEVTPTNVKPGSNMVFDVSLNTHSVELDYDYTEIAHIEDDFGNKYKATEWTGEKGGHHLGGTLSFDALEQQANKVSLTFSGIDSQDATFEWQL